MADTIDLISNLWSLTGVVNEIQPPNNYLRRIRFGRHVTLPTEMAEIGVLSAERKTAPLVRVNSDAQMISGGQEGFRKIATPNIAMKRPFTPSELLWKRRPGQTIFVSSQQAVLDPVREYVARESAELVNRLINTEEWMASQIITGTFAYSDETGDVFQITLPRLTAHSIDPGTSAYWDDTNVNPEQDVVEIKRLLSTQGVQPTDALLGWKASDAFRANAAIRSTLDTRNVQAGTLQLEEQFSQDGVIFLGRLFGINWWEYSRTVDVNGSDTDMIRPQYAEFFTRSAVADELTYYGAVSDIDAVQSGNIQTERFSKSWTQPMPSVLFQCLISRPLPILRRPNTTVSFRVTDA